MTKQQFIFLQIAVWTFACSLSWLAAKPPDSGKAVGGLQYVYIPPGTFTMGCVAGDTLCWEEELPQRKIEIKNGFWMTATEVTVGAFRSFLEKCGYTPESEIKDEGRIYQNEQDDWAWTPGVNWQHPLIPGLPVPDDFPVAQVSWEDAHRYCACMGGRLPTEAEWEYAARAGREGQLFPWGNKDIPLVDGQPQSNGPDGATKALYPRMSVFPDYQDGYATYAPVASFPPNAFGLYDMAGNVWEWCADDFYYQAYQYRVGTAPPDSLRRKSKIVRGGSWAYAPEQLRLSERGVFEAEGFWTASLGFRCIVEEN